MPVYLKILLIVFVVIYIINPYDLLPDLIPLLGWLDDTLLFGALLYFMRKKNAGKLYYWWRKYFNAGDYYRQQYKHDEQAGKEHFEEQKTGAKSDTAQNTAKKDPYEILGIKTGAGREEIKAAYRKAAQAYHPDKVSHLGKELQEMAAKKFIEIQDAYQELMAS